MWVDRPEVAQTACSGIGGGAVSEGRIELPVGIAKLDGILGLNVIRDTAEMPIPVLLPINLAETLGFLIDLESNSCTLQAQPLDDGDPRVAPLTILPSRHRCLSIVDFSEGGWQAPDGEEEFGTIFRIPSSDTSSNASILEVSSAPSNGWSIAETASSDIRSWSAAPSTLRARTTSIVGSLSSGSTTSDPWSAVSTGPDVDHHPTYVFL